MKRSMTRLWEEAWQRYEKKTWQDYGKKYDKVMEKSMTRLWQEAWPGHEKKRDHVMEITVTN